MSCIRLKVPSIGDKACGRSSTGARGRSAASRRHLSVPKAVGRRVVKKSSHRTVNHHLGRILRKVFR